jgi:integrase
MYAMAHELLDDYNGQNPCVGIKRFPAPERDRFMEKEELGKFLAALESVGTEVMRDAILMALWTGARRGNICAMKWSDISMDTATWRVPGTESKNKQPIPVHLSDPAMEILRRRKLDAGDCPWVFPGRSAGGHTKELKHTFKAVLAKAGLTNLRPHDLRRTFASWAIRTGSSLPTVSKALGHLSTTAIRTYARMHLDTVRQPIDRAVLAMQQSAKKNEPQQVPENSEDAKK